MSGLLMGVSCPCTPSDPPPLPPSPFRTVDVGIPQLSMHSIREMCGTDDVDIAYNHFVAFFEVWGQGSGGVLGGGAPMMWTSPTTT